MIIVHSRLIGHIYSYPRGFSLELGQWVNWVGAKLQQSTTKCKSRGLFLILFAEVLLVWIPFAYLHRVIIDSEIDKGWKFDIMLPFLLEARACVSIPSLLSYGKQITEFNMQCDAYFLEIQRRCVPQWLAYCCRLYWYVVSRQVSGDIYIYIYIYIHIHTYIWDLFCRTWKYMVIHTYTSFK